jgi:chlorite dismutase
MFTTFTAGSAGNWQVMSVTSVAGDGLTTASHLAVAPSASLAPGVSDAGWRLTGVASHVRYVERAEKTALVAVQAGLGRPEATRAALIPIRKSPAWWDLTQEERRRIFEDKSRHIADSMKYLPAIARQLYHCRDLGEPFDFLTWFEFAPGHAQAFEDLVGMLRATEEWTYVEREVDVRLKRER